MLNNFQNNYKQQKLQIGQNALAQQKNFEEALLILG